MAISLDRAAWAPTVSDADAFEFLLTARNNCRAFLPTPLDDEVIEEILRLAQRSPLWRHPQAWQVAITKGAATARVREGFCRQDARHRGSTNTPLSGGDDERRPAYTHGFDKGLVAAADRTAFDTLTFETVRSFDAPHFAVITMDKAQDASALIDCGAYIGVFLLAARSLGVATIVQTAIAPQDAFVRGQMGIPAERRVICGIAFGHADEAHPVDSARASKGSLEDGVLWLTE